MTTWDETFEETPAQTSPGSTLGPGVRGTKSAIRERIDLEHKMALAAQSGHGQHKLGSARVFVQDDAPADWSVCAETVDGVKGRVRFDATDKTLHVNDGSAEQEIGYLRSGDVDQTILGKKTFAEVPATTDATAYASLAGGDFVKKSFIDTIKSSAEQGVADAATAQSAANAAQSTANSAQSSANAVHQELDNYLHMLITAKATFQVFSGAGSKTYVRPSGTTKIIAAIFGACGAGGYASLSNGGGGGASGSVLVALREDMTGFSQQAFLLGAGGTPVGNSDGNPGADSTFSGYTIHGGGGGQRGADGGNGGVAGVIPTETTTYWPKHISFAGKAGGNNAGAVGGGGGGILTAGSGATGGSNLFVSAFLSLNSAFARINGAGSAGDGVSGGSGTAPTTGTFTILDSTSNIAYGGGGGASAEDPNTNNGASGSDAFAIFIEFYN